MPILGNMLLKDVIEEMHNLVVEVYRVIIPQLSFIAPRKKLEVVGTLECRRVMMKSEVHDA